MKVDHIYVVMFAHAVPAPADVTVTASSLSSVNTSTYYAGTRVELLCTFSLDPSVDTGVTPVVTWTPSSGAAMDPRILTDGTFSATLVLEPLTMTDTFTCGVVFESTVASTFISSSAASNGEITINAVGKYKIAYYMMLYYYID